MSWRDIIYLPKSDRKALVFLLIAGVILVLCFDHCGMKEAEEAAFVAEDTTDRRMMGEAADAESEQEPYYAVPEKQAERFAFDPNTADSTQFLRLGLQPWQVRNIYKYRAKGGIYRKKEDFAHLYGLTVKQYRELEPYIRISGDYRPAAEVISSPQESQSQASSLPFPKGEEKREGQGLVYQQSSKLSPGQTVSLSHADTTQLQRVPGIGPYFARRIVEYRQRLGGYTDVSQLMEIENFPEQALDYIDLGTTEIKRLNVNKLTLAQLHRHPYISYYQAKAITEYRRLYGTLKDITQLSLLKEFTDEDLRRLQPYLEY